MTGPLIPDLKFSPGEYVRTPANRDFFYLARKSGRSASSGRRAPSSG
jgi:hypothetical protein